MSTLSVKGHTAAIITLGCKVNQYESEAISERLISYGFDISDAGSICDVYIINTCTVTAESERKCRQMIRRAIARNPIAYILVCGCLAQVNADSITNIAGVDYVCGNTDKMSVAETAFKLVISNKKKSIIETNISDIFASPFEKMSIKKFYRTRAYVKIEDGCENKCTYCIIPSARGKVRSKPMAEVLDEMRVLIQNGCAEIVLTGIETGSYGRDIGEYDLADLLCEADALSGDFRIRTGSLDPSIMKKPFIDRIAKLNKLAPHFHLSMQSGSDRILALMKRKYNTDMALSGIEYLRAKIPEVMFTTDIITGFPGETDEDFLCTKEFVKKAGFLSIHIFPYSERTGTPAADMPGKVDIGIRHKRCNQLNEFQKHITFSVLDDFLNQNQSVKVLFETWHDGYAYGRTASFIDIAVKSDIPMHSEFHTVILQSRKNDICYGTLEKNIINI